MVQKIKQLLIENKILFLASLIFIAFIVIITSYNFSSQSTEIRSRASVEQPLNLNNAPQAEVIETGKTLKFNLYKKDGYLYKTSSQGAGAAEEFIDENSKKEGNTATPVLGAKTPSPADELLPPEIAENVDLVKSTNDTNDNSLKLKRFNLKNEHYFYDQKINGIPVFGASLVIHVKNKNEIYAADGSLVIDKVINEEKITEDQAKEIALNSAKQEIGKEIILNVTDSKKYVFNKQVLGISSDGTNYPVLEVDVEPEKFSITFSKRYFINLTNGEIAYSESKIKKLLNRKIYNPVPCMDTSDTINSCTLIRGEGSSPASDSVVNTTYDILGDVFNYYKYNYQRDSYDNNGSPLNALPHFQHDCPNAFWYGGTNKNYVALCNGLVTKDIIGHELAHAVSDEIVNLLYSAQPGSLAESLSDIFANAIDNNWTLGEGSTLGIVRHMDDPTRDSHPDRLFSSLYSCPADGSCGYNNDHCGIHKNVGVFNKAFYLMTDGGDFNGCSISGIGSEKSHNIVYRTMTTYLSAIANFKSVYNGMLRACDDLYANDGNTCGQVKKALEATEMDQQPEEELIGAKCIGATPAAATCSSSQPESTPTPTPETEESTPTPTPETEHTPTPSQPIPTSTLFPTATPIAGEILLNFEIHMKGVGSDLGENPLPVTPQKKLIVIEIFDNNNQIVNSTRSGDREGYVIYDPATKTFKGIIGVGVLSPGNYTFKTKTDKYLKKLIPGIYAVTANTSDPIKLQEFSMIVGDINNDNIVDIRDFANNYLSCLGKPVEGECKNSDLNDDGYNDSLASLEDKSSRTVEKDLKLLIDSFGIHQGD